MGQPTRIACAHCQKNDSCDGREQGAVGTYGRILIMADGEGYRARAWFRD